MKPLRFAVIGTGFWSNYQIHAWKELPGVELVAVCDRNLLKAEQTAQKFGVPAVYDNATELFEKEELDFVDIVTDVDSHASFTLMAADKGVNVVCQKPMTSSLLKAKEMVRVCKEKGVQFFVHENFRWQSPIRALKMLMNSGVIGRAFKAKVSFCSAFPVYNNQPFLAELKHFVLTDIGSHTLDICRFLFGEAKSLYCLIQKVNPVISGEDVANVLMEMENGMQCFNEISYASILEKENFPQVLILVEGERGSIHLTSDFELKVTTRDQTTSTHVDPVAYEWLDPAYAVVQSSIVECNKDILKGLKGGKAETTGSDNLKTVQLVWAAYESAADRKVILF